MDHAESAYPALRMAARTFCNPVATLACTALMFAAVKLALTDESSLQ